MQSLRVGCMVLLGWMVAVPGMRAQAPTKLEFDVVSIRENKSNGTDSPEERRTNVPIGPDDVFRRSGGLFSATNTPLIALISFAYKTDTNQRATMRASVPEWVLTQGYNIEARTDNQEVTKDQMRLMMRSFLEDRLHVTVHRETRQAAVYAVALVKAGVTGPQLRAHPTNEPCSATAAPLGRRDNDAAPLPPDTVAGGFPTLCGSFVRMKPSASNRRHEGGRNMPMSMIELTFSGMGSLGRPVIDATGLKGNFDFVMEFVEPDAPTGGDALPGPSFLDALKNQLGLKLEAQKAPFEFLLVDHVERPSEN